MELTMAEKRSFLERIRELLFHDVPQKEDRDAIYRICLVACERALVKIEEG